MSTRDIEDVYDLTPLQHGMLFENLYAPGEGTYIEQSVLTIRGALNRDAFWQAWQHVVDRHPALRTTFHWNDIKKPVQTVHRAMALPRTELDLRDTATDQQRPKIREYLYSLRGNGFDIEARAPMDICLARTTDDEQHLVLSVHHLILDGWSVGIILGEFMQSYRALHHGRSPQLPAPGRYRDYVAWWRKREATDAESFWRGHLDGYDPAAPLDLGAGADIPTGVVPYDWAERDLAELTEEIRAFSREHRVTPHTLVQGAWSLVLARCQHTEDLTVGTAFAHRPNEIPNNESVVGCMVCTVPIRTSVKPDAPALAYLREIQSSIMSARDHAAADLVEIHGWSTMPRSAPLFESLVSFQNIPIPEFTFPEEGIEIAGYTVDTRPQLPMVLMVLPGADLPMRLVHDRRRFTARQAELLLERVHTTLTAILRSNGDALVDRIDVRCAEERALTERACADPGNLAALSTADSRLADALRSGANPVRLLDARQREVPLGAPGLIGVAGADGTPHVYDVWARITEDGRIDYLGTRTATVTEAPEHTGAPAEPRNATEAAIAELMATILDVPSVGIQDNLVELGLHSLLGTRVINQIQDVWKISVSLRTLFDNPTVAGLAKTVESGGDAAPAPRGQGDLREDVTLDESITGIGSEAWQQNPNTVLLTGATGYLGAFLLDRLLRTTGGRVICLVRDKSEDEGLLRVTDGLRTARLWREAYAGRVKVVCGNLAKPLLGLSEEDFDRLASDVDEIFHAGATVNILPSYRRVKPTNVGGTREILRLAARTRTKPVHYISPAELTDHDDAEISGRELPLGDLPPEGQNGYISSKWVCERLMALANERGIPTIVYRAARFIGATTPPYWKPTDATSEIVQACAYLGMVPDSDVRLPASPVDYVASAMTTLARKPDSFGSQFHLVSPQPFSFRVLGEAMSRAGYAVTSVDIDTWYSELVRRSAETRDRRWDLVLAVVGPWKRHAGEGWREPDYRTTRATGALGAELSCRGIDADYLAGGLKHFAEVGLVPAPAESNGR